MLAWKRGMDFVDDVSLLDAVADMNRGSPTPMRVAEPDALGRRRVSGIFRTGDNASFAHAMASLHGLAVLERPDGLELK